MLHRRLHSSLLAGCADHQLHHLGRVSLPQLQSHRLGTLWCHAVGLLRFDDSRFPQLLLLHFGRVQLLQWHQTASASQLTIDIGINIDHYHPREDANGHFLLQQLQRHVLHHSRCLLPFLYFPLSCQTHQSPSHQENRSLLAILIVSFPHPLHQL